MYNSSEKQYVAVYYLVFGKTIGNIYTYNQLSLVDEED